MAALGERIVTLALLAIVGLLIVVALIRLLVVLDQLASRIDRLEWAWKDRDTLFEHVPIHSSNTSTSNPQLSSWSHAYSDYLSTRSYD